MRIDGPSQRSYPIKRKPQKTPCTVEGTFEEVVVDAELPPPAAQARRESGDSPVGSTANVPARPQDIIFPRSMSSRVAHALASYLTTASFVDWDLEVSGLDLHV
ncbi:hypothetical protein ALQ72_03731 [Pseudomonas syringae pv. maculicola]|uniref:Uncharacterized protein n=1 Tax=Pseudomonas syringae pv. maculicola TaxID=59511 RepID=A0A3M3GBB6_PSEYM|nr:hypothetical protein [Pseudomonas syringae group genomosp. 3]RMM70978.1 hypothetical protein ALQ72_03731 [Pseudomonas syringae pv. maculicola]RMV42998.1 hypothetical protein ALP13_00725 [Pseudomonas syringae pv. maculicola]